MKVSPLGFEERYFASSCSSAQMALISPSIVPHCWAKKKNRTENWIQSFRPFARPLQCVHDLIVNMFACLTSRHHTCYKMAIFIMAIMDENITCDQYPRRSALLCLLSSFVVTFVLVSGRQIKLEPFFFFFLKSKFWLGHSNNWIM